MFIIKNALIVNEGKSFRGYVAVDPPFIAAVGEGDIPDNLLADISHTIDADGRMLIPGVIDTHVHFRDPGMTRKGDMATESVAAVRGGVTSIIDMPNTNPATVTIAEWEKKMERAAQVCRCNYAFFLGATNSNLDELLRADYSRVAGVKLFLGSSTGNMLVDRREMLQQLFSQVGALIAVHAESEPIIAANRKAVKEQYADSSVPLKMHAEIRSRKACIEASRTAIDLAATYHHPLHLLHLSTADEARMLTDEERRYVTTETAPHYLRFCSDDYSRLGTRIKCNPAIKDADDRHELLLALADGRIDTIATDHAPHLPEEKAGDALTATSGMPGIRFSLQIMLEIAREQGWDPSLIVEKMAHAPARIFGIEKRGFIREGYYADLVLIEQLATPVTITDDDAGGRCGWTPYVGEQLHNAIAMTLVNGHEPLGNTSAAMPLRFERFDRCHIL